MFRAIDCGYTALRMLLIQAPRKDSSCAKVYVKCALLAYLVEQLRVLIDILAEKWRPSLMCAVDHLECPVRR